LASLGQVRALGERLAGNTPEIETLVNNAGVYRANLEKTEDGLEKTMAVNHLSHFLLTHLLLPQLLAARGRVINVSSEAHRRSKLEVGDLEAALRGDRPYKGWMTYSDSKLANILFTAGLAGRYSADELAVCSVHPGVLATRIWNQNQNPLSRMMVLLKPLMGRGSVGGDAIAFLAGEPGPSIHGRYFNKRRRVDPSRVGRDQNLAEAFWDLSQQLTHPAP
jgi:retinol dehydrogenase-12